MASFVQDSASILKDLSNKAKWVTLLPHNYIRATMRALTVNFKVCSLWLYRMGFKSSNQKNIFVNSELSENILFLSPN